MIIKRELGEKGQVVIPKDIREFMNLKTRENIVFEIRDNEVILKKEEDPKKFLEEFFDISERKKNLTAREIKKMILEQYEDEIPRR